MTQNANEMLNATWRAIYWEPVEGTGERLMVGVVYSLHGEIKATRTIRDDVLDCLYGKSSKGIKALIEHGLQTYKLMADETGVIQVKPSIPGFHSSTYRNTQASNSQELLRTAALLYSSLSQLQIFDEAEEQDTPLSEEVNRQFSTQVREGVIEQRPELAHGFGKSGRLITGGQLVRFGYFSPKAILHFSVLHPVRQSASVRDARAKLWELQKAQSLNGVPYAALISGIPNPTDVTLNSSIHNRIKENLIEMETEADEAKIRLHPVPSIESAIEKVIEVIT